MKETVPTDRGRARLNLPAAATAAFAALSERVEARSQIIWAEHCSECAYPACYTACAFYAPRGDLHCRRFVAGIEAVEGHTGLSLIRFRRWGKLEGRGPATLRPAKVAARQEALEERVSGALAAAPLPFFVSRNLTWRWNERKRGRLARPTDHSAQSFVIESCSADGRTHPFTVTFLDEAGDPSALFQARFEVSPAYGRLVIPVEQIAARIDLCAPFLVQIEPVGDAQGREVVFGLADFVAFKGEAPASVQPDVQAPTDRAVTASKASPTAKVVVWDLDETLWRGTLAEDGAAGVQLREGVAEIVRALDERGILQSVASKNDAAEALAAIEAIGLKDYFLHPQIHWSPKSGSVREIAARLDLGLDSIVFIDDQPFERAEVQDSLPQVRALPHTAVSKLLSHAWFDVPVTAESRKRRSLYQAEAQRSAAAQGSAGDYLAFLRSSDIVLDIAPLGTADLERVYELSQRTNQLNFTGAKFSREEVERLAAPSPGRACLTLRCADRFGDYGLIGFAVLDLGQGRLDDFFMSCRVQRKRVEHAAFAHMAGLIGGRGHASFRVRFRRTERNKAAVAMLTELGFELDAEETTWSRPTALAFPDAEIVRLAPPAAAAA